ncbi:protease pro-enzyme activation domain-containing protein [Rhodanobacter sp. MP7CTX1]|uniref:protease pro-enzyme activation domain-containing protein n=1 Tax=Rhodanobacter sp. MP7CTX1 TaxID=2723084 RepID=UPI0016093D0C|nr:protease pro-enzyme activation domain-containing protein [Rhodanobacter sp. MP7CTX1]MBB6187587.1 hypothetical protein [Rhodanobacter sp. MP7CTX1]
MIRKSNAWLAMAGLLMGGILPLATDAASAAQQAPGYYPNFAPDTARIITSIDNSALVAVKGSELSQGLAKYDSGALLVTKQLGNMTLLLKRSAEKQAQFTSYLNELTSPNSPYFHHWLTAKQVGTMFGPSSADLAKVTQWLTSQGLSVKQISADGMTISFSGTTGAVNQAFHVQLHTFNENGESHFGNPTAQQIPAALAPVVDRVASLGNFFPKPMHVDVGVVNRNKTTGKWHTVSRVAGATPQLTVPGGSVDPDTSYDVAPADFNQIYNVNPLWNQGTPKRGAGQTIVVLERTDVNPADIAAFRAAFLPGDAQGSFTIVHPTAGGDVPCTDPGINGDESEAALDAEWAGAAAPDANIVLASCADTSNDFGAFQAAIALEDSGTNGLPGLPPASIWSLSYGACELEDAGDTGFANILWSGAAAQGITVFVASGDGGAAACAQGQPYYGAIYGSAVNGMASSIWDIAVGGTDFNDFKNYNQYWTPTNLALGQSAIGYIPEQTWNDSCASSQLYTLMGFSDGLTACNSSAGLSFLTVIGGGGGASMDSPQPAWQLGVYGSVNYSSRTLPDVSLFAANGLYGHALVYCMSDTNEGGTACDYSNPDDVFYNSAGGTSFAAPAMAGIQALINQATGGPNGLISPALYHIATTEYGTNGSPSTALLTSCNSSNGANIGSQCVFNNVGVGGIVEPCLEGSLNCQSGVGDSVGVTMGSTNNSSILLPAWQSNAGYNMATGLGSVNVANLVAAVQKYLQPLHPGYSAPYDFLGSVFQASGFSDIALVDPIKGILTPIDMVGSVISSNYPTTSIAKGYSIGAVGNLVPQWAALGLQSNELAWTGADNRLYIWMSEGTGGFFPNATAVGPAYAAGWQLIGSGVNDSSGQQQLFWFNAKTSQFGWWKLGLDANYNVIAQTISTLTTVAQGYVPTLADVNGDGYTDIVWTSTSNNSVYVWINNQNGGFIAHRIADHPADFSLFGAGDINGDGKTDLIWTNPSTNQMAWWLMDGFAVTDQEIRGVSPGYTMASIADYNNDGLADILWMGKAGDAYEWQSAGNGFQSLRVADPLGNPLVIPAGALVQVNRLQGSTFVSSP